MCKISVFDYTNDFFLCTEKAENVIVPETEKFSKNSSREDFKRYRKEFLQPVQFRFVFKYDLT